MAPLAGRTALAHAKRVVVKIGTNALTNTTGRFHRPHFERLAGELLALAQDRELVIVSSGAIALGVERLGLAAKPKDIPGKQACAAVGQSRLMRAWEEALSPRLVAQVLLTHSDVQDRRRYLNARHALERLIADEVVPVINENDTVSVDEIKFGDNDTLGALVANLVEADALVILTDQRGLYSADPRKDPNARFIDEAIAGTPELELMAGGAGSSLGRGGMITKILAAKRAAGSGASTVIAWGREPDVLLRLAAGEAIGTALLASTPKLAARKQWMADHLQLRGAVTVDAGAAIKLRDEGKSLLPIGVVEVQGDFHRGDVIAVRDPAGVELARGLTNYSSAEARLIARKPSFEFERVLGYAAEPELIHRDNLVLA